MYQVCNIMSSLGILELRFLVFIDDVFAGPVHKSLGNAVEEEEVEVTISSSLHLELNTEEVLEAGFGLDSEVWIKLPDQVANGHHHIDHLLLFFGVLAGLNELIQFALGHVLEVRIVLHHGRNVLAKNALDYLLETDQHFACKRVLSDLIEIIEVQIHRGV